MSEFLDRESPCVHAGEDVKDCIHAWRQAIKSGWVRKQSGNLSGLGSSPTKSRLWLQRIAASSLFAKLIGVLASTGLQAIAKPGLAGLIADSTKSY
jgi:hypothetical protein